jgi:hypothetical protein
MLSIKTCSYGVTHRASPLGSPRANALNAICSYIVKYRISL